MIENCQRSDKIISLLQQEGLAVLQRKGEKMRTCFDSESGDTWSYLVDGDSVEIRSFRTLLDCRVVFIPHMLEGICVTGIGSDVFACMRDLYKVKIPNGVKSIGDWAFRGCTNLPVVTIPDSVISIGYGTFWGCWSLTSVSIPDSVTNIREAAFRHCKGLSSVTIGNGVRSIGDEAFADCVNLRSMRIPNNVLWIGVDIFRGCEHLTSVLLPERFKPKVTMLGCSTSCEIKYYDEM